MQDLGDRRSCAVDGASAGTYVMVFYPPQFVQYSTLALPLTLSYTCTAWGAILNTSSREGRRRNWSISALGAACEARVVRAVVISSLRGITSRSTGSAELI